ncbi:hypothetical protein H8K35_08205 [Undibacterium sp. LX40W]|uniref:Uncharacterized protein n=1 Tax=Undibacterium nitidum TaxID=2762298 RepID=A0A923HLH9_9BURK|nr:MULTISPECIES: hypothetical protein [Undibacterium]MBC3881584.1 hypothetical protein [Undibacterium nitidum]MBC3891634.1 hypothetical protein [Undibacterium sp. LX40W]
MIALIAEMNSSIIAVICHTKLSDMSGVTVVTLSAPGSFASGILFPILFKRWIRHPAALGRAHDPIEDENDKEDRGKNDDLS